jgi:hypothetical protein
VKQDLRSYSANIVTADLNGDGLVDGVRALVALAMDQSTVVSNYENDGIAIDWSVSLKGALDYAVRMIELRTTKGT